MSGRLEGQDDEVACGPQLRKDDASLREHCGVVGIYSMRGEPVAERIVKGLSALQHRGQESWGIAVQGQPILKGMGLLGQGVDANAKKILNFQSSQGIGHVRYSTKGRTDLGNAH